MTVLRSRNAAATSFHGLCGGVAIASPCGMRAVVVLVASRCAYKAGSFSHFQSGFVGQRASVGCLDISVERRADLPDGARVLGYGFGNRCERPQVVDLGGARVVGRTWEGNEVALHPFDPRGEIRVLKLDGRSAGNEALAYHTDERLAQLCIDVASIAHTTNEQWLCFASDVAVAEVTP